MGPSFGTRIPGVEGLRALAASSVLLFHVWRLSPADGRPLDLDPVTAFFPDLALGVTLFFSLSGFLLYRPFVARVLRDEERPAVRTYLANRARRIVPAYWVILLVSAVVLRAVLVRAPSGALDVGAIGDPEVLASTMLLAQNYLPATVLTGIGPAWSLAVEVVFYLLLPVLAVAAERVGRRMTSPAGRLLAALAPAAVLLVVGLGGKLLAASVVQGGTVGAWEADWGGVLERSFLVHADLFAFGMALAVLHVEAAGGRFRLTPTGRATAAVGAVLAYGVVAAMTTWEQLTHSPYNTLMAGSCTLLLAIVVLPRSDTSAPALVRLLETRPLVAMGTISYSVFLWHEPIIRWLRGHDLTMSGPAGFAVNLTVVGVLTVALSVLTYRTIEAPFLRRRRGRSRAASPAPGTVRQLAPTET